MNPAAFLSTAALAGMLVTAGSEASAVAAERALMGTDRSNCAEGAGHVERTEYVMGTLLRARIEGVERGCGLRAIEAAFREAERLDGVLSSWRVDSEIGRLNVAPAGTAVRLSAELTGLLREVGRWVASTGGAFDPAVGALVDAWDLRGAGRIPSDGELAAARAATGWEHVRLEGGMATRLVAGVWLDTGGFGKGAALRAAAAVLRAHGIERGVLDFGGQLMVLGALDSIAVAHPRVRELAAAWLRVGNASVATASASERFVEAAGVRLGHIIDPHSARPVAAWGSVTVIMADPLGADALSTALFVLGPDAALAWASDREDVGVLVLRADEDGRVLAAWNAAMTRYLAAPEPAPALRTSSH